MLKKICSLLVLSMSLLASDREIKTPTMSGDDRSFCGRQEAANYGHKSLHASVRGVNPLEHPEMARALIFQQIQQLPTDASARQCHAALPDINQAQFDCYRDRNHQFKVNDANPACSQMIHVAAKSLYNKGINPEDPGFFSVVREEIGWSIDGMLQGDFHENEAFVSDIASRINRVMIELKRQEIAKKNAEDRVLSDIRNLFEQSVFMSLSFLRTVS